MTGAARERPDAAPDHEGEARHPRAAAVDAARRVVAGLLALSVGDDEIIGAIGAELTSIATRLEQRAPDAAERIAQMWSGQSMSRHDPATGELNALAPPLPLTRTADDGVVGTVALGLPYQGPPGCVHGGIAALLLDHALGVANVHAGHPGMTATLTLRFHAPTPLFVPLTVSAHLVRTAGRKIHSVGEIRAGESLCVSAEALFISAQPYRRT